MTVTIQRPPSNMECLGLALLLSAPPPQAVQAEQLETIGLCALDLAQNGSTNKNDNVALLLAKLRQYLMGD